MKLEDSDKKYKGIWKEVIGVLFILLAIAVWFSCSSCNIFQALKKDKQEVKNDSVNVKKETETSSKVDTSKTKTETIHTKETIYQPQPIYIQGKDGETKVIFVPASTKETGESKEEKQNFNYDNYRKEIADSLWKSNIEKMLSKESETKGSVLGIGFWLGVAGVGIVLIGILFMLTKFQNQIGLLIKK